MHDFERKILRPRKIFEIFGRESHEISRAAACRRSAHLLVPSAGRKQAAHHQAAWISARSRAIPDAKFCGRENFSKISVDYRTKSHAPRRADALRSWSGPQKVVSKLCSTERNEFWCNLTRFRTQNFETAKFFRNFRGVRIGRESHAISRAAAYDLTRF